MITDPAVLLALNGDPLLLGCKIIVLDISRPAPSQLVLAHLMAPVSEESRTCCAFGRAHTI